MTEKDMGVLLATMATLYPNYKVANKDAAIKAWLTVLGEYDPQSVQMAFNAYLVADTTGFAPSPGQLIAKMHIASDYNQIGEQAAWAMVLKALRNSGYNSIEEFEKLPPIIQKVVGHPANLKELCMMETATVNSVEKSHFLKSYREQVKLGKDFAKLPKELRESIGTGGYNAISSRTEVRNHNRRISQTCSKGSQLHQG